MLEPLMLESPPQLVPGLLSLGLVANPNASVWHLDVAENVHRLYKHSLPQNFTYIGSPKQGRPTFRKLPDDFFPW